MGLRRMTRTGKVRRQDKDWIHSLLLLILEQHGVDNYNTIRYDTKRDEKSNDQRSPLTNRHPLPSHSQHIHLSLDLILLKTW